MKSRQAHLIPILSILILSIAIYSNTLWNEFVYDDTVTIANNRLIIDLHNLPMLFKKDYFLNSGEMTYRPVVTLTYFLDYSLFGLNPFGYHMTNVLLHAFNGVLLYAILTLSVQGSTVPVQSLTSLSFILPSAAVVSLMFIAIAVRGRWRWLTFGVFFFFVTLLPVYDIIPISCPFAERYLYLPMAGFAVIAGGGVYATLHKRKTLYTAILLLVVLGIYSFTVVKRNGVWANDYSLWSDTITKAPGSSHAYHGLANAYHKDGRLKEAAHSYQTALRLNPYDAEAHYNLSAIYDKQGNLEDAIQEYQTTLTLMPDNSDAYTNLGVIYYRQGRLNEALQQYQAALALNPRDFNAYYNLGHVYYKHGQSEKAIEMYNAALKLEPKFAMAHYHLGIVYSKKGLKDNARMEFEAALKLRPDLSAARKALEAVGAKE